MYSNFRFVGNDNDLALAMATSIARFEQYGLDVKAYSIVDFEDVIEASQKGIVGVDYHKKRMDTRNNMKRNKCFW